jgi:hypothetical protein
MLGTSFIKDRGVGPKNRKSRQERLANITLSLKLNLAEDRAFVLGKSTWKNKVED